MDRDAEREIDFEPFAIYIHAREDATEEALRARMLAALQHGAPVSEVAAIVQRARPTPADIAHAIERLRGWLPQQGPGYVYGEPLWDEWEPDLRAISQQYPDALLELRLSHHQVEDVRVAYFSRGLGYQERAFVALPVFDPKRLA